MATAPCNCTQFVMTPTRWVLIVGVVLLFVFAKGWILTHPKSSAGIIVGAIILILSESADAA